MDANVEENTASIETMEMTTEIVAAYVSNNPIPSADLASLIRNVHATLQGLSGDVAPVADHKPAIPVKKSVTDDFLICLEDGKKFKSLKRHLRAKYDMTPEEYREKWGLPFDYPMVAPSYARKRSKLAKEMGVGTGKK